MKKKQQQQRKPNSKTLSTDFQKNTHREMNWKRKEKKWKKKLIKWGQICRSLPWCEISILIYRSLAHVVLLRFFLSLSLNFLFQSIFSHCRWMWVYSGNVESIYWPLVLSAATLLILSFIFTISVKTCLASDLICVYVRWNVCWTTSERVKSSKRGQISANSSSLTAW